ERFPWVEKFTPINEPLTTARFSGLYGIWYPHEKSDFAFLKMLLNQCRAIILAMREIMKITPKAQLIQTEDLGKVFTTPKLQYQADFENERRWLTWDLLCGNVDEKHALWDYLLWAGIKASELHWFLNSSLQPEIIGVNYYVTSERFLDRRIRKYPNEMRGGNGHHAYVDTEAVRVLKTISGFGEIVREAYDRYEISVAVTEVHLGCTREEQMRWLDEAWKTAILLKSDGVDIRAITSWALLGSHHWNCLLQEENGYYESGAFDIGTGILKETAIAKMLRALLKKGEYNHPVLKNSGWWREHSSSFIENNFTKKLSHQIYIDSTMNTGLSTETQTILITGASGTLGRAFKKICDMRGLKTIFTSREDLDIADSQAVEKFLDETNPWAIINTAGYVRVDDAETEERTCYRENTLGNIILADMAKRRSIRFMTFSSDLVFDGEQDTPYVETDIPSPLNIYGRSKFRAERCVTQILPEALIIRTSAFFGPWDNHNFLKVMIREVSQGNLFFAADDAIVSPTYVPDLVNAALDAFLDEEKGILHLANVGEISWYDFAQRAAQILGLDTGLIIPRNTADFSLRAKRPRYTVLKSEKRTLMPTLENALERFTAEQKSETKNFQKLFSQAA
ncbi:MAG TPA: SDR family oxidoreductase, partial [Patescibacteria group bacterium]|nr:SDR family oxidoreductase [Patescibacteria group bacterium]